MLYEGAKLLSYRFAGNSQIMKLLRIRRYCSPTVTLGKWGSDCVGEVVDEVDLAFEFSKFRVDTISRVIKLDTGFDKLDAKVGKLNDSAGQTYGAQWIGHFEHLETLIARQSVWVRRPEYWSFEWSRPTNEM